MAAELEVLADEHRSADGRAGSDPGCGRGVLRGLEQERSLCRGWRHRPARGFGVRAAAAQPCRCGPVDGSTDKDQPEMALDPHGVDHASVPIPDLRRPRKLLVQGCRGVRIEQAGSGRSIDQAAMFGFSANLDYSPRRSETFGAYLLGTRSLFNDRFSGGPGVYVYEEMPYFGRKPGLTGRGFEGLTDGLMKVFGI